MQHNPERLYDAINASELGAIITEHRNMLLCGLLRPMLDTFEQEGIHLSAVLRALATLAQERSRSLSAADSSNPWLECEALLTQAQAMAAMAEQRPKVVDANGNGSNNAVLDYFAQSSQSEGRVGVWPNLGEVRASNPAITQGELDKDLDSELEGLDISRITANLDLSRLGVEDLDGEFDEELEADLAAAREAGGFAYGKAVPERNGNGSSNGNGGKGATVRVIPQGTEETPVDWSQVSEEEAWARELLEDS